MATNPNAAPQRLKKASKPASANVPVDGADTSPTCYLLDKIPAEMRNTIYELVFIVAHDEDAPVDICKVAPPSKALTMTCRQIYQEARGLYKSAYQDFWCESNFIMKPSPTLLGDIQALREDDLQHVQRLAAVKKERDDGIIVTYTMLSSNGAWEVTTMAEGAEVTRSFYVVNFEDRGRGNSFLESAKEVVEESFERQLKSAVQKQLAWHSKWLRQALIP